MKKSVLHLFNFVMKQKCVSGALLVKEMKFFFQTPFLRASPTTWRSGCHILDYMNQPVEFRTPRASGQTDQQMKQTTY